MTVGSPSPADEWVNGRDDAPRMEGRGLRRTLSVYEKVTVEKRLNKDGAATIAKVATCGRIEKFVAALPPPFKLERPRLARAASAEARTPARAPTFSVNWCCVTAVSATTAAAYKFKIALRLFNEYS
ncbi:Double-stranded RNA-specific editase Adar [Eumeta japonica]|uniref:Double-stranded RNA-specific editase Adar n=1 Tax=Eumeta variegata TaxID=151549 RepID=A0A4C1WV99_EUMVA|nr:Double-stranded RNA-specific editase Adar [Eumeta japonica]